MNAGALLEILEFLNFRFRHAERALARLESGGRKQQEFVGIDVSEFVKFRFLTSY